jgi:hypothetical protein
VIERGMKIDVTVEEEKRDSLISLTGIADPAQQTTLRRKMCAVPSIGDSSRLIVTPGPSV